MKRTKMFKMLLMSAVVALGINTAAMAADTTVDINKVYKLANAGTVSPAETFSFAVTPGDCSNPEVKSAPQLEGLTDGKVFIEYGAGAATTTGAKKTEPLSFPITSDTRVGEYYYEIKEVAGSKAGVDYSDAVINVTVTVVNKEDGTGVEVGSVKYDVEGGKLGDGEGFGNLYEAAQDLQISKEVTGNLGDKNKNFTVTVTLTGEAGSTYLPFEVFKNDVKLEETISVGTETNFELKHDDKIVIKNIPYGVTYTVVEDDYTAVDKGGYEAAKYTVNGSEIGSVTGEEVDAAKETVVITNRKGTSIDTGVIVENLPYIILIAVVLAAAVVLFFRKRANTELD